MSDRDRSSTADTTPIGTPRGFANFSRKPEKEKEKENLFAWHHRNNIFAGPTSAYVDSTLLDTEFTDLSFPLFNEPQAPGDMLTRASPMDIATSSSNRIPHTSNLTSALQMTTGNEARPSSAMNKSHGADSEGGPRDSFFGNGGAPESYSAAQPIFMKGQKPRRESSAAGSMATGMSLSGNSVSSAIHE